MSHPTDRGARATVSAPITRGQLLARSAKGGAALLVTGSALGQFAASAAAAPLPAADLAYARLLVGAELLASDFYAQAIAAANTGPTIMKYLKLAHANEQEHYQSVAGILGGAGQTPAVSGDIDFSYPDGTFAGPKSIVAFAQRLETTVLGAYLGAVGGIQTNELKIGIARIAACEAQHVSYFSTARGGKPFSLSFPTPLTIDEASNELDTYTA
jgi:Ca2+-binding RTX toxin-like protein